MSENRSPPVGVTLSDEARESGGLYIKQVARIVGGMDDLLAGRDDRRRDVVARQAGTEREDHIAIRRRRFHRQFNRRTGPSTGRPADR